MRTTIDYDRRRFLQWTAGVGIAMASPVVLANAPERRLQFLNLHTGERANISFWEGGEYNQDGLSEIQHLLRDHRTDESYEMSTDLLDLLHGLQHKMATTKPIHVISGYRSPKSNAMLRTSSTGVAKRSLHMQGKAIDIRIPGIPLKDLRKAALQMKVGGVGYYPKSDFIHVDVGRVRQWQG